MAGLLWRLPWLLFALCCGYILFYRWQLELLTLTPINPLITIRVLMEQGHYAEAADQVAYFLAIAEDHERSQLTALATEIATHRADLAYQAGKIQEGLVTGSSDEVSGQIAGLTTSLLVIGDVRDLVKEGLNWLQDEPTDEVIIALATLGMVASATQLVSLGSTSPLKAGVTLTKLAQLRGVLPRWLRAHLIRVTQQALTTRSLAPVLPIMQRMQIIMDQAGWRQALTLLPHTRDPGSLNRLATLARHFGSATAPLVSLGGDAALASAPHIAKLGLAPLRHASRYGPEGIHALQVIGPLRFVKYGARLAKWGYTYPWLATMGKYLLKVPPMVWAVGTIIGLLVGLPWPWRKLLLS